MYSKLGSLKLKQSRKTRYFVLILRCVRIMKKYVFKILFLVQHIFDYCPFRTWYFDIWIFDSDARIALMTDKVLRSWIWTFENQNKTINIEWVIKTDDDALDSEEWVAKLTQRKHFMRIMNKLCFCFGSMRPSVNERICW